MAAFQNVAPRTGGSLLTQARIGRYRLVRPLSKGGMALVYEGRRESLAGVSPRVAIKLILPEHASSETYKELFINEARLGASMQHQNLVQIQDFDCEGDTWFLVMEYVEGLTLRRLITLSEHTRSPIPMGVIAEIGRQACDGLHFAHTARDERGRPLHLVHRDVKPSNLILNPHGVVKVLDFGISKGRLREERKGSVKGTWGYMAPEQAVGADVGPTADVFGLAVVLYEMASLRPMFVDQGKDEIRRLLKDDHAARMAATLDGLAYGPLIGILVRALQRDPAARFEDAASFGRALADLLPDPVTTRDEVMRLHDRLDALDRGSRIPRVAGGGPAGEVVVPRPDDLTPLAPASLAAVGAGVMLSLGALAALGLVTVGAVGEPGELRPGPAAAAQITVPLDEGPGPLGLGAPGERSGPVAGRVIDREEALRLVHDVQPGEEAVVDDPDAAVGTVELRSRQPAEVYVDGQFVAKTPTRRLLPPGLHTVSLIAIDGRSKVFDVQVVANQVIRKQWDFDRMESR
ncbi:MAG: serine/threonine-protein kinase [Myxococcota bacterium]